MKRELVRTLVYTDAHFLYADSTYGHRHNWWPEWDAPWAKRFRTSQEACAWKAGQARVRGRNRDLAAR